MNRKIAIFFILIFFGISKVYAVYVPHHMKSERDLRKEVYQAYDSNPYFYKAASSPFFRDTDFYILTLKTHIKKLQKKVAGQRFFLRSKSLYKGFGYLGVSIVGSGLFYYMIRKYSWKNLKNPDEEQGAVCFTMFSALAAVIGGMESFTSFNKVINYSQRLLYRLERDKTLLTIFEMEKRKQQEKDANGGKNEN